MKRLETAVEEGREPRVIVDPPKEPGDSGRKIPDFRKRGAAAKRYSGLAAALVCVIGLAAVVGVMSQSLRMGKSSADEGIAEEAAVEDNAGLEFAADETVEESAADEPLEESAAAGEQEAMAPDWQEQLLLESAKADELVTWHLNTGNGDGSIELVSEVPGQPESDGRAAGQILRASAVYEVYYEQQPDEWERVYHTDRVMDNYTNYGSWEEWYLPEDLNMTKAGTYRLVRQVNQYRQVLQLTLDER